MWGTFFWWVQGPPVDGCSTASCNFGALAGGDEWASDSNATLKNQLSFLNLSINIISYFSQFIVLNKSTQQFLFSFLITTCEVVHFSAHLLFSFVNCLFLSFAY